MRAVLAWTAFLAARGITTGPLFTRIDRWGNVGPAAGGRYADPPGSRRDRGRPLQPEPAATGALARRPSALSSPPCASPRASPDGPKRPAPDGRRADANGVTTDAAIPAAEDRRYSGHSLRRGGATSMLAAGAQPLHVSRHGRWSDGSRSFAGYVEEATGFGDANPTKGLLLCTPVSRVQVVTSAGYGVSPQQAVCATGAVYARRKTKA